MGALAPQLGGLCARIKSARDSATTYRLIKRSLPFVGEFLGYQMCVGGWVGGVGMGVRV